MASKAPRDQQRAGQPDIYWRRRVIALAGGIAILALLAWTVNGAMGTSASSQSADVTHVKGKHHASVNAPSPSAALGSSNPSASPSASPRPSRHKRHAAAKPKSSATSHASAAGARGQCAPRDVVLSLTAATYTYGKGALPHFQVDVVSTAARTCSFDIGPKNVQVIVRSGNARVWGSGDCARSGKSSMTKLARGVPTVLRFTWNRTTSSPGCRLARTAARPGTYTATARSGQLRSNTKIFVLTGRGVAVP
ncbi:MAG TPA: hypothetical protein VG253_27800 [Streptosporangiaceae bacterium]|jgi:hypothetical protein|nr:hypothetical protein [Streptosporangiaceae bacterium]